MRWRWRGAIVAFMTTCILANSGTSYAAAGSLDASFGSNGAVATANMSVAALALQPDGKILAVGGYGDGSAPANGFAVQRFHPNGTLDTSFGSGGRVVTRVGAASSAHAVVIQPDGKIVAAGCGNSNGACTIIDNNAFALVWYNTNGTLDTTFGSRGVVTLDIGTGSDVLRGVGLLRSGKITAGGQSGNAFAVARFNQNGALDTTFANPSRLPLAGGYVTAHFPDTRLKNKEATAFAAALQPDDKVVVAGDVGNERGLGDAGVIRFLANGAVDPSFGENGRAVMPVDSGYRAVQGVAVQPNGAVVVVGTASRVDDTNHSKSLFAIGRFTASGTPDGNFGRQGLVLTDFSTATLRRNSLAAAVAMQPDGKVVVAGHTYGGVGRGFRVDIALARYLPSGALDTSFGKGGKTTPLTQEARAVRVQPDGKILAGGYGGVARFLAK